MCTQPVLIKNPNFGLSHIGYNYVKDCDSTYIKVPCGHCPDCIAVKQMSLVQRVQMESLKNEIFYCTLTYNNESLPSLNVNGYLIRYADVNDVRLMIKRIRKNNSFGVPFRYFAVSELGSEKGRPHFHILFFIEKSYLPDYTSCINLQQKLWPVVLNNWTRNIGSHKKPIYIPLCTYHEKWSHGVLKRNFDFHYVNPSLSSEGVNNVSWYTLKYMLKPSDRATRLQQALKLNLDESSYQKIWNKVRPRYFKSLDFGLSRDSDIQAYLKSCINSSKSGYLYPCFINPDSGQFFPLSRFYKSKGDILNFNDSLFFYNKSKNVDSISDSDSLENYKKSQNVFNKKSSLVFDKEDDDFTNF